MLNLKPLAPGREGYYLRTVASGVEDYYLGNGEAPGSWTGQSAQRFGLRGRVAEDDLRAVLAGTDPRTGERLTGRGRGRKRTVPGWDATFRAPKSVSLLWALSDPDTSRQVREAHDRRERQDPRAGSRARGLASQRLHGDRRVAGRPGRAGADHQGRH